MAHIVVSGASSLVGSYLLPKLLAQGHQLDVISRNQGESRENLCWHQLPLEKANLSGLAVPDGFIYIHLAPLWLLPPILPELARRKVSRIIAFSSTSVLTKQNSPHPAEQAVVAKLQSAEQALVNSGLNNWTIIRPTLIYAAGRDKNVAMIAELIRRVGIFPLIGSGKGLRQPVHAEDLASAVVATLLDSQTHNKIYALSGGETLSYRAMIERVFQALNLPIRIVSIPSPLFAIALRLARCLPRFRHLHMQMAYRMNQDLCFDHSEARQDFGYAPRKFDRPLD